MIVRRQMVHGMFRGTPMYVDLKLLRNILMKLDLL